MLKDCGLKILTLVCINFGWSYHLWVEGWPLVMLFGSHEVVSPLGWAHFLDKALIFKLKYFIRKMGVWSGFKKRQKQ